MTGKDYQQAIKRTLPAGMTREQRLAMLALGLGGETGEVVDHIKKHLFQGHELDAGKVADECGDVLWYMGHLLNEIGTDFESVQRRNVNKLIKRYPRGYSAADSINREEE